MIPITEEHLNLATRTILRELHSTVKGYKTWRSDCVRAETSGEIYALCFALRQLGVDARCVITWDYAVTVTINGDPI